MEEKERTTEAVTHRKCSGAALGWDCMRLCIAYGKGPTIPKGSRAKESQGEGWEGSADDVARNKAGSLWVREL